MVDHNSIEKLFKKHGYDDFKWINTENIVVSQWVRFKCLFGCKEYGKNASCPPNVPSIEECREFFGDYTDIVVLRFEKRVDKPEDRHKWSKKINKKLLELEKEVFISGYRKTCLLFMDSCSLCSNCPGVRTECKKLEDSRPSPESLGVDVFATVQSIGYPIEVLRDYGEAMNRYAFLMID